MSKWTMTDASRKRIHSNLKQLIVERGAELSDYGLWMEVVEICRAEGYNQRERHTWDVATKVIHELGQDEHKDSSLRWLLVRCFEGLAYEMHQMLDERRVIREGLRKAFQVPRGRDVVRTPESKKDVRP